MLGRMQMDKVVRGVMVMDKIRIEVDGRTLGHEEKEEMRLRLERAVGAIYGGNAAVTLEPNVAGLRRSFASRRSRSISNIMAFGRKIRRSVGG